MQRTAKLIAVALSLALPNAFSVALHAEGPVRTAKKAVWLPKVQSENAQSLDYEKGDVKPAKLCESALEDRISCTLRMKPNTVTADADFTDASHSFQTTGTVTDENGFKRHATAHFSCKPEDCPGLAVTLNNCANFASLANALDKSWTLTLVLRAGGNHTASLVQSIEADPSLALINAGNPDIVRFHCRLSD